MIHNTARIALIAAIGKNRELGRDNKLVFDLKKDMAHFKWDVFVAKKFTGEIRESDETIPEWVELEKVSKLNLIANTENAIKEGLELMSQ